MSDISFLASGFVFGASAGLSPGPLLALVLQESLRHGPREGLKVSVAPLLTDGPIIALALVVLVRLENVRLVLGAISLAGAAFLAWLAYESLAFPGMEAPSATEPPRSLAKGVIANCLNPSPYLFWFAIGGPTVLKAAAAGPVAVAFFLASFYVFLVGGKAVLAVAAARSRFLMKSGIYVLVMRILGGLLLVYAGLFFVDGLKCLGFF